MKVAFILASFPALAETFILNQITGLLDLGHDVELFAHSNPGQEKVHQPVRRYGLMERTHYFNMPASKTKARQILSTLYLLLRNFHKDPSAIMRLLNIFKYGRSVLSPGRLCFLIPFLGRRDAFDIIHCHYGPNGNIGVLLRDLGVRGKLITTFHAYDVTLVIAREGRDVYNRLFAEGDLLMPISKHWRKRLIDLGCSENKIVVHRVGLDMENFPLQQRQFHKGDTIKLLTVSRLVEKKGLEYAIQAVARVIRSYPDGNMEYRIVGNGPLQTTLEKLITELGVNQQVKLLGWVDDSELKVLMADSDISLLPSVTGTDDDQEGIPGFLIEALATGMPVISTYHSGIPELIQNGKSGFLVPERDVGALSGKLEYLIAHPEQWSEMGQFGREFVEDNYDIRKLNRRLVRIYQSL